MACNRVIVVAPEHLNIASASSQDVELHWEKRKPSYCYQWLWYWHSSVAGMLWFMAGNPPGRPREVLASFAV